MTTMLCITCLLGCGVYGFKGISISADIKTFYVSDFSVAVQNATPDIDQQFAEQLRQIIRNQSKLRYEEQEPDIIFEGAVSKFNIQYLAPEEGNTASLNRLEISVTIDYTDYTNEKASYSKSYSDFEDFDSNQDFSGIERELTDAIITDIVERIFNDTFTNW